MLIKEIETDAARFRENGTLEPLTRLTGGYETLICRFKLSNVDEHLSKPLTVRVYAENTDPYRALKESMVQNTMADLGYPYKIKKSP